MIIDAHSHAVDAGSLDSLMSIGGDWVRKNLNRLFGPAREKKLYAHDVVMRLAQLDRNGVDMQVVTPISSLDSNICPGDAKAKLAYAATMNDGMVKLMKDSKGRLLACGTIPLEDFENSGRREMNRAVEAGIKAFTVPTHVKGRPLDLPGFERFWDTAADLGTPVYIHPRDPAGFADRSYEAEYRLAHTVGWPYETELALMRIVFSGMMERYPSLVIVSHHLGGGLPFFMGRIMETYADSPEAGGLVCYERCKDFSRIYYDTAVGGSAAAVRCAYDVFGAGQLVFATDAPFGTDGGEQRLAEYPGVIRSLGLTEDENRKIFSDNIRKIFKLA
jgi:uncharacterized protein